MENTRDVEGKIAGYIAENILFSKNGYSYDYQDSFLENGIIDSMNVLELVMFVEENFGFKVKDDEILPDNFDSVSKLASFVYSRTTVALQSGGSEIKGTFSPSEAVS
jgi:acyl carrier protein